MNKFYLYTIKSFIKYLFIVALLIFLLLSLSAVYSTTFSLSEVSYTLHDVLVISAASALIDINKVIPIIVAVAVMITILMLMRSNELLGYMTIGGSVGRLVIPFFLIGVCISILMIFIEYKIVPESRIIKDFEMSRVKSGVLNNRASGFYNTWFINQNNVITNVGLVSISEKEVYNVVEYIISNDKITQIQNIERIYKNGNEWFADNITIRNVGVNPPQYSKIALKNITADAGIWDKLITLSTTNIKALNPKELYIMVKLSKEKGLNSTIYVINLYYKFASAISVIVLVLLLFPISINFSRNYSIIKNAAITFGVAMIFILSQNIGKAMGDAGVLSPFNATFGPLILFFIISIIIIYNRSRAR